MSPFVAHLRRKTVRPGFGRFLHRLTRMPKGSTSAPVGSALGIALTVSLTGTCLAAASGGQAPLLGSAGFSAVVPSVARDQDGDGLSDAFERLYGLNPNAADSNRDGLLDPAEDP